MNKFLIVVIIFISSCSSLDQKDIIITDEGYKFDISSDTNFKNSITNHFDNFGINYNADNIIVLDINKSNINIYKSILQNNTHVAYLKRNPEQVFNLINLIDGSNTDLLQECINAFLRYHSVKNL